MRWCECGGECGGECVVVSVVVCVGGEILVVVRAGSVIYNMDTFRSAYLFCVFVCVL